MAIEIVKGGNDFHVALLDQQMPVKTGVDTLKEIKELTPSTEVLLVTAISEFEVVKGALKLGAFDYINKPFEKEELRAAVRKGVERHEKSKAFEKAQGELEFVHAQLLESEKFSAIGQLIASVVHELNTPLGAVIGFSEVILMGNYDEEMTRKYIENIHKGAFLCRKIVQKLLSFSRKHKPNRELIMINDVIEATLDLVEHNLLRDNTEAIKDLAKNIPGTMADFHELQQVFLNLINNAHQAMASCSDRKILKIKSERDDKLIRIRIQDSGPGIPQENLQKIFEPLFTTKEKGEGTGLGLSVCGEIIREHNGDLYVASELGKGACFIVEIPIVDVA
jgi:two-component system NtrC family sensor kinase